MKLSDVITQEENLKVTDLENLFNINLDQKGNYVFNLNETIYLNIPKENLKVYIPDHPQFWPLISYELYKTPRLDWLLMKLNNVSTSDVFRPVPATKIVYYIDTGDVQDILDTINGS